MRRLVAFRHFYYKPKEGYAVAESKCLGWGRLGLRALTIACLASVSQQRSVSESEETPASIAVENGSCGRARRVSGILCR